MNTLAVLTCIQKHLEEFSSKDLEFYLCFFQMTWPVITAKYGF